MPGSTIQAKAVSYQAGGNKILSNANLCFRPGQIAAVIGPSGSGKSTLLKCLTTTYEPSEGLITVNGKKLSEITDAYRQILGYVPQDDIIHRQLRVESAFYYAAKLRLDAELEEDSIQERIDLILGTLGLAERRWHRISKLSGGQRKRVNIGIELLADPQILILDEPASGLDPGTEEDLVGVLRELARQQRTIVKTTHSMEFLDKVEMIVLLQQGSVIFAGNLEELLGHFGIVHIADVFKRIREKDTRGWVELFQGSPLSSKAAG